MNIPSVPPVVTSSPQQRTRAPRRVPLVIYTALAVVFLLCVVVQVFLYTLIVHYVWKPLGG